MYAHVRACVRISNVQILTLELPKSTQMIDSYFFETFQTFESEIFPFRGRINQNSFFFYRIVVMFFLLIKIEKERERERKVNKN